MKNRTRNWPITIGIVTGVLLGVALSKTLDRWPTPVIAEGTEGSAKKAFIDQSTIFRNASKIIAPAVVNITTLKRRQYQEGGGIVLDNETGMPFYRRPKIKEGLASIGAGSGFIIDAQNGYVLTNNHVVAQGDSWIVRLADKRELEARLVGADPQTDVAVLKIEAGNLSSAILGDSDQLAVGDWVLAVGNPFGLLEQTVTAGIISAKGRSGLRLSNYEDFLQTDAAINQGNSGGPLVNLNGEIVGVNTAILSKSGGYQGIGFSIPINQARKVALKLIKSGSVTRGWMGVETKDLTPGDLKKLNIASGASVEGVYMRGPAQQAGLLPGDILMQVNGKAVHASGDVRDLIADMEPGLKVPMLVRRKEKDMQLDMIVGTQPKDWGSKNQGE